MPLDDVGKSLNDHVSKVGTIFEVEFFEIVDVEDNRREFFAFVLAREVIEHLVDDIVLVVESGKGVPHGRVVEVLDDAQDVGVVVLPAAGHKHAPGNVGKQLQ